MKEITKKCNALQKGHFLLSSGKHSNFYFQAMRILENPSYVQEVIRECTPIIKDFNVVIAPAIGGITWGFAIANYYNTKFIFAERENGDLKLRRGFSLSKEDKVLIAEDVMTTGQTVMELVDIVQKSNAEIVGVQTILNRMKNDFPILVSSYEKFEINTYDQENCPMCRENIPFIKPGSKIFNNA